MDLKKNEVNKSAGGKDPDMVKIVFSRMTDAGENTAKSKWV